ncbi:hypothetical protein GUJ93_ZPchr0012g20786 [Zizania palustris]|uniref:Uncharacterized protein n=1 Tax=Zizania palustris TaxID=103762 RepID=A0A8J5WN23_ZIZPA|nr:hypothetical protein GUJ93_ZPchr0012g20786 [Zizania palustris]
MALSRGEAVSHHLHAPPDCRLPVDECIPGLWAAMHAQFPCGVHRLVAPVERQVLTVPVLRAPQPGPERAQQPSANHQAFS